MKQKIDLERSSEILRALAHPKRLQIFLFLLNEEHRVKEIMQHIGTIQPITSQHLKNLRQTGIVRFRREGTTLFYYLTKDPLIQNLADAMRKL